MSHARTGLFAVVAMVLHLGPLSAQQPPCLARGQRVRVTIPSEGLHSRVASIAAVSADSITVWMAGRGMLAVPVDSIQALEVSLGRWGDHRLAGFAIGALGGGIVGALIGAVLGPSCSGFMPPCKVYPPIGAVIGVLVGGGIGSSVGSKIPRERWKPVSLEALRRLRVGIVAQPAGRLGLGASLAF